jgi:hypothetical protein
LAGEIHDNTRVMVDVKDGKLEFNLKEPNRRMKEAA